MKSVIDRIDPGTLAEVIIKATAIQEMPTRRSRTRARPYRISEISITATIRRESTSPSDRVDDPMSCLATSSHPQSSSQRCERWIDPHAGDETEAEPRRWPRGVADVTRRRPYRRRARLPALDPKRGAAGRAARDVATHRAHLVSPDGPILYRLSVGALVGVAPPRIDHMAPKPTGRDGMHKVASCLCRDRRFGSAGGLRPATCECGDRPRRSRPAVLGPLAWPGGRRRRRRDRLGGPGDRAAAELDVRRAGRIASVSAPAPAPGLGGPAGTAPVSIASTASTDSTRRSPVARSVTSTPPAASDRGQTVRIVGMPEQLGVGELHAGRLVPVVVQDLASRRPWRRRGGARRPR